MLGAQLADDGKQRLPQLRLIQVLVGLSVVDLVQARVGEWVGDLASPVRPDEPQRTG